MLLDILFVPICALVAVVLTALMLREDQASDRRLMQYFMVFFSFAVLIAFGFLSRPSTQRALNPELERAHTLQTHPVFQLVRERSSSHKERLAALIGVESAKGTPVPEIAVRARPILELIALEYLGFADEPTKLAWARVALQTMQELKARDPLLCFRRVIQADMNSDDLKSGLSAENSAAFQAAFIAVVETGYAGMGQTGKPPSEKLELADVQTRYREIMAPLEDRFGREAYRFLAGSRFGSALPPGEEAAICSLRIAQLELALKERPAMAARMVDSLLR